jgi:hypothetical protein
MEGATLQVCASVYPMHERDIILEFSLTPNSQFASKSKDFGGVLGAVTVVSRVSAHRSLNITRDFGPHGRLPRIKIPYICIEAATVTP